MEYSFVDRPGLLERGSGVLVHATLCRVEDPGQLLRCRIREDEVEVPAVDVLGVVRTIHDGAWSGSGARAVVLGIPERPVPSSWAESAAAALRERLADTTVKALAKAMGWTQVRVREVAGPEPVTLSIDELLDVGEALGRRPSTLAPDRTTRDAEGDTDGLPHDRLRDREPTT